MKTIAVIGAGGLAREVAALINDIAEYRLAAELEPWSFLGFLADRKGKHDSETLGDFAWLGDNPVDMLAMGIGNPRDRLSVGCKLMALRPDIDWPALVHPAAYLGSTCTVAAGAIICVKVIATENVQIGELAFLNFGCTLGHEAKIGPGCTINPGAHISGGVEIEEGCMIGSGAVILQYMKIGRNSIVGAGAVVTKDIPCNVTVKGVPAR